MAQLFGDCLRDAGARVWLRAAPDLFRTIPITRIEATMENSRSLTTVGLLALVTIAAVAVVVGVGGGVGVLLALVVIATLVWQRRRFAVLGRTERAPLKVAILQAWWAPVAATLGVVMVLAGVGTIFEAHNLGGRIVGSAAFMLFGLAMLLGLVKRPFAREAGNTLILVATVPALAFFWLVIPLVAAVIIWAGVIAAGFSDEATAAAT